MSGGRRTPAVPRFAFEPGRVVGVDVARGLALLGMFVAHTVLTTDEKLVDGRSSILFAVVAGVSIGLLTGGASPPSALGRSGDRVAILVRGVLLIALGILLALLSPPLAVILDYYGVGFLLLVPLLFVRRGVLVAVGMLVVAVAPPVVALLVNAFSVDDVPVLLQPFAIWLALGNYPVLVWMAFLLAGLLLARSDLSRRRTQAGALVLGVAAAIAGYGAAAIIPGVSAAAHSGTAAEVIGSGGLAIAVVAGLTLLGALPTRAGDAIRLALWPLAATGSMAFSLYCAHVVVLTVVREIVREGDRWTYPVLLLPALLVGSIAIAVIWRRFVGSGPLETAMRWITRAAAHPRGLE